MQITRRWLNQIALEDPIQRRQAYVLQFVILAIIAVLLIATVFVLFVKDQIPPHVHQLILLTNGTAAALMFIPWFLLRRGKYKTSVIILISFIFLGIATYLFIEGVSQNYFLLLFAIPITLSGLLLGRFALWLTIGISVLLLSIPSLSITPPVRPYNPTNMLVSFTLLIVLQGLLLDRLVAGLWDALTEAIKQGNILAEREQEKQRLLAAAEQHIRERDQIEAVLLQTQKLESLGAMASGIAHDFNNLLSAILGQASVARLKLPPDSPALKHIDRSIVATERAADLTRQLLIYSGRGQIEHKLTNLNQILEENLHLFEVAVPHNVQLTHQLMHDLPFIMADPGQMQQVVMNLLMNSVQAIGDKPGYISISTRTRHLTPGKEPLNWQYGNSAPHAGPYVVLEVEDSGEGMSPEILNRIFEPFFTTKETGHGLGLATVLGIVRTHQGGAQVESDPGSGTTFRLFFPASRQYLKPPAAEPLDNTDTPCPLSGRILLIDDDDAVITTLRDILEMEGFSVLTAPDGARGVQMYHQYRAEIQLVLLDISMPGMDGIDVLRRLQAIQPGVRVIISSGLNRTGKLLPLTEEPNVSYLHKPYDAARALSEVKRRLTEQPTLDSLPS